MHITLQIDHNTTAGKTLIYLIGCETLSSFQRTIQEVPLFDMCYFVNDHLKIQK